MKLLDPLITKYKFDHSLIKRSDSVALYKKSNQIYPDISYEVFIIRIAKPTTFNGHYYPLSERYPCNSDFGYYAWNFNSLDKSLIKFDELLVLVNSKKSKSSEIS